MSGPGVLRLSGPGSVPVCLLDHEMWRVATAPVFIGYATHSVRTLVGDFIFMMLPAGGLRIGFWAHGKLSTGIAPVVHNFYTYAG